MQDLALYQWRSLYLWTNFYSLKALVKVSQISLADCVVCTDSLLTSTFCWVVKSSKAFSSWSDSVEEWQEVVLMFPAVVVLHSVSWSFATMHQWFIVLILLMPLMCFRDYLLSQIVFKCSFPDKVFDRLRVLKLEVFAYHKSAAAIWSAVDSFPLLIWSADLWRGKKKIYSLVWICLQSFQLCQSLCWRDPIR